MFSKYDEGILMTDSAWYGVTPEPVAKYVAIPVVIAMYASPLFIIYQQDRAACFDGCTS